MTAPIAVPDTDVLADLDFVPPCECGCHDDEPERPEAVNIVTLVIFSAQQLLCEHCTDVRRAHYPGAIIVCPLKGHPA